MKYNVIKKYIILMLIQSVKMIIYIEIKTPKTNDAFEPLYLKLITSNKSIIPEEDIIMKYF